MLSWLTAQYGLLALHINLKNGGVSGFGFVLFCFFTDEPLFSWQISILDTDKRCTFPIYSKVFTTLST